MNDSEFTEEYFPPEPPFVDYFGASNDLLALQHGDILRLREPALQCVFHRIKKLEERAYGEKFEKVIEPHLRNNVDLKDLVEREKANTRQNTISSLNWRRAMLDSVSKKFMRNNSHFSEIERLGSSVSHPVQIWPTSDELRTLCAEMGISNLKDKLTKPNSDDVSFLRERAFSSQHYKIFMADEDRYIRSIAKCLKRKVCEDVFTKHFESLRRTWTNAPNSHRYDGLFAKIRQNLKKDEWKYDKAFVSIDSVDEPIAGEQGKEDYKRLLALSEAIKNCDLSQPQRCSIESRLEGLTYKAKVNRCSNDCDCSSDTLKDARKRALRKIAAHIKEHME